MTKTVLAFGTFDLLHLGHLYYLEEAKKLGDRLVVIVARDARAEKLKGKPPVNDENHRLQLVQALRMVDQAMLGKPIKHTIYDILSDLKPDIMALGYDQNPLNPAELQAELDQRGIACRIVRIPPFQEDVHKSSKIKARAKELA